MGLRVSSRLKKRSDHTACLELPEITFDITKDEITAHKGNRLNQEVGRTHLAASLNSRAATCLNRQILHSDIEVGELKAESAEKALSKLNPTIKVAIFSDHLNESTVDGIVGTPDVIVDCLDNFETRYLLNRQSIKKEIPPVHGAIGGMRGQVTVIQPPETPCFRRLFPEPPPGEVFPVVGVTPGLGSIAPTAKAKGEGRA